MKMYSVSSNVVVLGGGYDFVHDTPAHPASPDSAGASIHMLDHVSGAELWRASSDLASDLRLSSMTRAIPTRILAADLTGDGMVNRMYASDLGQQLLRFDITNGETPANLVACVGVECFDPGFANDPVRTLWTQDGIE